MAETETKIIESIQNFIKTCPLLDNDKVRVDYLGENAFEYSIEPIASEKVIKRYLDGSKECQQGFNFCSREYFSRQVAQNISNSNFYEDFEKWLEECTRTNNLPILNNNRVADSIQANSTGYLYSTENGMGTAKYVIQCNFKYTEFVS